MFSYRAKVFSLFGNIVWIDVSWLVLAIILSWSLAVGVFPRLTPDLTSATYWTLGIVATIGLMGSILLHELAHSLVARHFGLEIGRSRCSFSVGSPN